jgi:hypothetical protein
MCRLADQNPKGDLAMKRNFKKRVEKLENRTTKNKITIISEEVFLTMSDEQRRSLKENSSYLLVVSEEDMGVL